MFNSPHTVIQTDRSFLKTYSFSDPALIENAINETKDKLNVSSKRMVGFFSDAYTGDYKYGKIRLTKSQPLTPSLSRLLEIANSQFETDYNGIIINEYKTGLNVIQKHSDSKNHPDFGVIIISYGVTRNFRVFDRTTDVLVKDIPLIQNEAIHMGGDFQLEFTHDVELDKSILDARYSISFHKYMNLGLY
jgi:alkylated DNA repair dioxygenase AlkB